MVRTPERHDLGCTGVTAGGENSGLVGLRATVRKEGFGQLPVRRNGRDLLRQGDLSLSRKDRRDVLQLIELGVNFLVHSLVAMADADGDDTAKKVEVLVAVSVPDVLVSCFFDNERGFVVVEHRWEQVLLLCEENLVFGHCCRAPA